MTVDQTHQDESRAMFGLGWTGFLDGIIAPVVYTRLAAQNALASYALPTPSIFVSARTRALGLAQTGAKITTSGQVTEVYERNGHHYTDQVHLVFADDRPVALVHRTSIYVARAAGKA